MFPWSPLVFAIVMIAICVAGLLRGGWEERVFGALYMGACMASLAVEERPWTGPQGAIVAIDAGVLAGAVGIAMASRKLWPIGAAAFQVLTLGAHLAFIAAAGRLSAAGYLTVLAVWSYGTIGCLACGAALRSPWRTSLKVQILSAWLGRQGRAMAPLRPTRSQRVEQARDDRLPE